MARETETYCDEVIFKTGIGHLVVCRYKSGGRVEVGCFLVDVYCLGVKDAFFRVFEEDEFQEVCLDRYFPRGVPAPRPASWGRKLVEEAVRYAASLGFTPHADFKKAARVFGGVDASECEEEFVFGNEGKPFYVQGPYDGSAKAERILTTLRAKFGDGGFHYMIPMSVDEEEGEEDEEEDGEEDEEEDGEEDEEDCEDVRIFAMDSQGTDQRPDHQLVTFAENFRDQNEGFDGIEYGGHAESLVAAYFLEQARRIQEGMNTDSGLDLTLHDATRFLQTLWNLRILPEEDRAEALRSLPAEGEIFKEFLEEASGASSEGGDLILDFLLLNTDVLGKERLLLLSE